jgi:hypothetical protein
MASVLSLAGVAAWPVYLDLPMHGRRRLPGGLEEFMALAYQDAVLKVFAPQATHAADEFPAVLAGLRAQLPATGGPIGVERPRPGQVLRRQAGGHLNVVEHAVNPPLAGPGATLWRGCGAVPHPVGGVRRAGEQRCTPVERHPGDG